MSGNDKTLIIVIGMILLTILYLVFGCDRRDKDLQLQMASKGYCWQPGISGAISGYYKPCPSTLTPEQK